MKNIFRFFSLVAFVACAAISCNKELVEQPLLELDRSNMKMNIGQSQKLNASLKGAEAEFEWNSTDAEIVSVTGDGEVTALAAGTAKIVVSAAGLTKECEVVVVDFTAASMKLNKEFTLDKEPTDYSYLMLKDDELQILPRFYNADGERVDELAYPKYDITASNPSKEGTEVLSVNEDGLILALNPGTATIKVSGAGKTAHLTLTVKAIELSAYEMSMFVKQSDFLIATVLPETLSTSEKKVVWASSAPEYAKVSSTGAVTALQVTSEPVIISARCGQLVAECCVSVVDFLIDAVVLSELDGLKAADGTYQMFVGDTPYSLGVKFEKDGQDVTEKVKELEVNVAYNSSDPNIAVIDNGIISVKNPGTTEISVSCAGQTNNFTLNVIQCVESVQILSPEKNPYVVGMDVTEFTIGYAVYPENASVKTVTFSSTDESVAIVEPKTGKVTVKGGGNTNIVLTSDGLKKPYVGADGSKVSEPASVNLILVVSDPDTNPSSLSIIGEGIENGILNVQKGATVQLGAEVAQDYQGKLIWNTSTPNIISVNENGQLTALSIGTGKVVLIAGGAVAELTVNVAGVDPTAIKINEEGGRYYTNVGTILLTASMTAPENGDFAGVNWYTSDPSVATVASDGLVTVKGAGEVIIIAKAKSSDGTKELENVTASVDFVFEVLSVKEVAVNLPKQEIEVGETIQLGYRTIPSEAELPNQTWSLVSGNDLVDITPDGKLTGKYAEQELDDIGVYKYWRTATVLLTVDLGNDKVLSATAEVKVIPKQPKGIELVVPENGKMRIYESWSFNPRVIPYELNDQVSIGVYGARPSGAVAMPLGAYAPFTPEEPGIYSITFYTSQSDNVVHAIQRNVVINVQPYWVESVSLPAAKELAVGSTTTLLPTFTSDVAGVEPTDKTLTWTSSDESIATVDNLGRVSAKASGTVEITATTTGAWSVPSVSERKSATCKITVVVPTNPVYLGDYVYTDGTWSTQLDNSKTVAGVVFALTDATASDPKLADAYSGCTHGLAMSVTEYESSVEMSGSTYTWQDVYNYAASKGGYVDLKETGLVCGYSNTAAMKAFKAENGEYSVYLDKLEEQDAVKVTGASSWYMPSIYELSLISKNFDALNAVLNTAGKTSLEAYKSSWTGAEYQGTYWHSTWGGLNNQAPAWGLSINAKAGQGNMMMTNNYPVRFVFAF